MKRFIIIILVLLSVVACKKQKFEPEGPTDVRVQNLSSQTFNELTVNTSGGIQVFGTVIPGAYSVYLRFEKAYPKAEISAKINGVLYTTGPVDVTYMQYLGQDQITYYVNIPTGVSNKLEIQDVTHDAPIVLK